MNNVIVIIISEGVCLSSSVLNLFFRKKKTLDEDEEFELEDLKRDKARLERKVEKLTKELEEVKESCGNFLQLFHRLTCFPPAKQLEEAKKTSTRDSGREPASSAKSVSKKDEQTAVRTLEYQLKSQQREKDEQVNIAKTVISLISS